MDVTMIAVGVALSIVWTAFCWNTRTRIPNVEPLFCGDCGVEIIFEDPPQVRPTVWGHIPCPARVDEHAKE